MLLTRLDHLSLAVPDVATAAAEAALVLGQTAQPQDTHGVRLQCENIGLVLHAADADVMAEAGMPMRLVFATGDLGAARHRLERRGLAGEIVTGALHLDPEATHGVRISVVSDVMPDGAGAAAADIVGLDHVVVRTRDAERAVALYGGRLGLDLRLDRLRPEIGVRQMFFVLGGLVVEVVQSLKDDTEPGRDSIWGLAWRSRDIEASHARLVAGGVSVSAVRDGRKAGTRVATVKSHTQGVPTLLIGGEGLDRH